MVDRSGETNAGGSIDGRGREQGSDPQDVQALSRGDADGFLATYADDVKFTVIGTGKYSGTYNGRRDLFERLLGPTMAQLESSIAVTPERLIAEGDYVVLQSTGVARTKKGKPYNNTYCHVFKVIGGRIVEATEYVDTELVARVLE